MQTFQQKWLIENAAIYPKAKGKYANLSKEMVDRKCCYIPKN